MKAFLSVILLFSVMTTAAQNRYVDSLKGELNRKGGSSQHIFEAYHILIDWFRVMENTDEARLLINEKINMAARLHNHTEQIRALVQLATLNPTDYENIQDITDSVFALVSQSSDPLSQAYAGYLQAYRLNRLGEQQPAVEEALKVLGKLEDTGDHYIAAKLNYLLYTIYAEWIDLERARIYALQSVRHADQLGNMDLLSNAYAALAVTYTYQYDQSGLQQDLDSVLITVEKAAALYIDYPDRVSDYTYAIARINEASYLLKYFPQLTPDIRNAIESHAGEILSLNQKLKNGHSVVASAFGILSELARKDNHLKLAEQYLLRAYTVLLAQEPVYYHTMINVVRGLSELYAANGDYKEAFKFQQELNTYSRKLFNQNQAETSKRLEAVYRFEKKEQEMQALEEKSEYHRRMKLLYAVFGLLGLVGAFFMFRSYHYRLRYSLTREKQLDAEKHEAETQVKLEREEQARLKAEQALLNLQQQKLQDEVLANQLHIQHKNEVLQNLKSQLTKDNNVNIQQVLREESLLDSDFEKAKFHIQELHPNFFKNLSNGTSQKLTALDLKYCAYLYLGMDTKQIATLLNVAPKSVRMAKYRLKKKFSLGEEEHLEDYIKQLNS